MAEQRNLRRFTNGFLNGLVYTVALVGIGGSLLAMITGGIGEILGFWIIASICVVVWIYERVA